MAAMIPDNIPDDASESERIVFQNLMGSPHARDWTILCSRKVENPDNPVRPRELDFLIFIEEYCAVIYLEAKGGHYECTDDMQWYFKSSGRPLKQPPPKQAESGMYALKDMQLSKTYFSHESLVSLGCVVAFSDWDVTFERRPAEVAELITRRDVEDPARLGMRLQEYARQLTQNVNAKLCGTECREALDGLLEELKATYMPIEEEEEPLMKITRSDLENLRPQLVRLTTEQMVRLELTTDNPRCVLDGSAGTGKTVLAMELARRHCEVGETVGLMCNNPNLSRRFVRWANTLPGNSGGHVLAGTPMSLPLAAMPNEGARRKHRQRMDISQSLEESLQRGQLDNDGWESFVEETIKDLGTQPAFDYLIVDEAQNLSDEVFLKLQDALVRDGLDNGRWTMFGDFKNQNLVTSLGNSASMKGLRQRVRPAYGALSVNCRNTQEIAEEVARVVRIESPTMTGVHGPLVQFRSFATRDELGDMLDNLIRNWREVGFQYKQMIVLSSGTGDEFDFSRFYGGRPLVNIREAKLPSPSNAEGAIVLNEEPNQLRYSAVYDFQGLESDLVILVIPVTDDQVPLHGGGVTMPRVAYLDRVLYTGMSRAKAMLVVIAHESYDEIFDMRRTLYETLREQIVPQ